MPSFNIANAYQAKEPGKPFFDDGREIELLHHLYSPKRVESLRNSPSAILAEIDVYARTQKYLMNVGEDKGRIVTDLIRKVRPRVMVELGGYVGYSTLLFGSAVKEAGGSNAKYYSFERNPEFAAVIMSLVSLAGLQDTVQVIVGSSEESIRRMHRESIITKIDLMFLDHYKPAYVTDLKLCEELGWIDVGTYLAADNVVDPGNPPYLEYVRSTVEHKREAHASAAKGTAEGTNGWDSRMAERSVRQYETREGLGQMNASVKGRPEIEYRSELVDSFEPTGDKDGVEITECVTIHS